MAWAALAAAVAPSIIGALAGQGAGTNSQSGSTYRNLGPTSPYEAQSASGIQDIFSQLQQFQGAGPGQQDISGAYNAQNDFAKMLQQYAQGGYAPTQADQNLAKQQLAPQFEQARQNQIQGQQQFRQQAAISGRGPLDFAFTNRLNQTMGNQMNMLAAQQSQIAAQQPLQRLGFMQDYTNLKQGLASQAMQNRMAVANLGASIRDSERNLRMGAASTTQTGINQMGTQQSNMLQGGLAGLGTGLSLYNKFGNQSSSGGDMAAASPWDNTQASAGLANLISSQGNAGSSYGSSVRGPASSGFASPSYAPAQQSTYGVPSFLNPATTYSAQPAFNPAAGMPAFLQRGF